MKKLEQLLDEFADGAETANTGLEFENVGTRLAQRLGFRWFAYLNRLHEKPFVLSSYPQTWTRHYVEHGYERIDPVVRRSVRERYPFCWDVERLASTREQRRFLGEARAFGIRSGITLPIRGGFGRTVAFTLAFDERMASCGKPTKELLDIVQSVGIYFHAHTMARLNAWRSRAETAAGVLTQRELQCLAWVARGKTMPEIALLVGISARTVSFHLDNARSKLGAVSIAQCVGEAFRRGLLV